MIQFLGFHVLGDTFIATTIHCLSRQMPLGEAIQYGCKVASLKCTMNGFENVKNAEIAY